MFRKLKSYISEPLHLAIGLCFMLLSVLFAFWITRIPEVKGELGLSEGDLGTALFFTPLGAICSMLLSSQVIRLLGEGRSAILSLLFYAALVIAPVAAFNFTTLCLALFGLGFCMGWVDISINSTANAIEKQSKVKIMSTSHGFFSLGGILGGVLGGILAGLQIDPVKQMLFTFIAAAAVVLFLVYPKIEMVRDSRSLQEKALFALPGKSLIGLAIIAFCIMLGEGAIADWSTVYMTSTLSSGPALAGFGFAMFSAMMTLGRFNGDYLIEKFGSNRVVSFGLLLALAGLGLLFLHSLSLALLGFGLIGLGYSSVVPILFSKASQKKDVSPAKGLASVATFGYFGFLIGPVVIGWLAEYTGLTYSFGILLLLTAGALLMVRQQASSL
jgi:MFS family permease